MKIREMDPAPSLFITTCKLSCEKFDELSLLTDYELSKLFDVPQERGEELCQLRCHFISNCEILLMILEILAISNEGDAGVC